MEQIIYIISYEEICFGTQVFWIATMFPEWTMLTNQFYCISQIRLD